MPISSDLNLIGPKKKEKKRNGKEFVVSKEQIKKIVVCTDHPHLHNAPCY